MANQIYKSNSTINQPVEWMEEVASFCRDHNISRNELIHTAVLRYMESFEKKIGEAA